MTEKRFYCIDEDEYNSYWIADTSKVDKNKEDFYDEKEELYQIYKFEEYLEDNNAVLKGEEVVDLLNELHEENMMLKEYNNKLMTQPLLFDVQTIPNTMRIMEANTQLEEENEQLKQQMQRLYNYFADWFDNRVPPSDFSEMWDFVKEDEKWD